MRKYLIAACCLLLWLHGSAQVKIKDGSVPGTLPQPKPGVVLELESNNKGVLFPRLSSAQRNAIANPPHGLHIFNTDESCLNYYDSLYSTWNCYCENDTCKVVTITLNSGCNVDFYNQYAIRYPAVKKYVVKVDQGTVLSGCSTGQSAIAFTTMPNGTQFEITLINYGIIAGAGGNGGRGGSSVNSVDCSTLAPVNGVNGGHAIVTKNEVKIKLINYGLIAGAGGGGAGAPAVTGPPYPSAGGGGGGGAGILNGNGGGGGGLTGLVLSTCTVTSQLAAAGTAGTQSAGGTGGNGHNGGAKGGGGGSLGQPGQSTTRPGGLAGKVIAGGLGNSVVNAGGGQSFGEVD